MRDDFLALLTGAAADITKPDAPDIMLQRVMLTNSTSTAVQAWRYGVLFRKEGTQPLNRDMGSVQPGQTGVDQPNFFGCAYRKLCRVVMADGTVLTSPVSQLPDGQCYDTAGWIITKKLGTSGQGDFVLLTL
jgi:hypothetical protein